MEVAGAYQDRGGSKWPWSTAIQAIPAPEGVSACSEDPELLAWGSPHDTKPTGSVSSSV